MAITEFRSFIIRHRFAIRDLGLLTAALLSAAYCAFAIDIFHSENDLSLHHAEIDLDEALLLGVLLALGLLLFGTSTYLRQKREMDRRLAAEAEVRKLAYQDVLTGLPNRRRFDDALCEAIASPPRAGAVHAVLLLDLNGFKAINDIHGHGAGDALLTVVAQRLLGAMRDGDIVARFGGDEFAILATHLGDPEAATNIALRVIEALEAPIEAAGAKHRVGAGIGIALIPIDTQSHEEAIRKADVALYRAKAERRSALRFFEPSMDARVQERAALEAALRRALDEDRIEVVFLPTFDLRTHAVTGFDASPRWNDPVYGEVPHERFIAIAEEVGLIHAIGEKVLRLGCVAARSWPDCVTLSVDIHSSQLRDNLLAARIVRILTDAGLPMSRLEVDITESAFVADLDNARAVLPALRAAGARVALDNFGTGYSSLYHLRNFRLDKVKIDRSFIEAMTKEPESAGIVQALIGLGQGLGLEVAAEGITALDQEGALLGTGCFEGKGDLLSEPLDARGAAALFDRAESSAAS